MLFIPKLQSQTKSRPINEADQSFVERNVIKLLAEDVIVSLCSSWRVHDLVTKDDRQKP